MRIIVPNDVTEATLTSTTLTEDDYAEWSAVTTYARGDFVISVDTHTVYRGLTADNLDNDPDLEQAALADPLIDDPAIINWQVISATNRWKMFDKKPSVQATDADNITVVITPGTFTGGVAGFNVDAASVTVTIDSVAGGGEVFTETVAMQDETVVIDWYTYFFSPIVPLTEFVLTEIPPYSDAVFTVSFDRLGGNVGCGQLLLGDLRVVGTTTVDNTGFTGFDFSFVEQDIFGNLTTVQRAATRVSDFDVFLDNSTLLGFETLLRGLRGGVAAVWIGDPDARKAAINYGFYLDYRSFYKTSEFSIMSIKVQGIV